MVAKNYVSIDHTLSFQGLKPWVKAAPLKKTTLTAPAKHTATVILLHGFANSGEAWVPIAKYLQSALPYIKFILPNAPLRLNTLPDGTNAELPSWYDPRLDISKDRKNDQDLLISDAAEFEKSLEVVRTLVVEEARLVDGSRVFLGGFSQGVSLATFVALTNDQVGGVIGEFFRIKFLHSTDRSPIPALSAGIPHKKDIAAKPASNLLTKAVFIGHGDADPLAPVIRGSQSSLKFSGIDIAWSSIAEAEYSLAFLESLGFTRSTSQQQSYAGTATLNIYPGLAHFTNDEEIEQLRAWLSVALPESK
ncbi:Alpha/Beta hydrolase protein [Naematelia encephala]|uniref:Acyl-protein thioesterase 1 n=1 Tax=Naematelia encephala TaxID=71784 RepID=A0A1Y2AW16_9TREE|nr:Alpha/Beta hydrolase protein [Naematelia encephala]